jgi:hypothetical protein
VEERCTHRVPALSLSRRDNQQVSERDSSPKPPSLPIPTFSLSDFAVCGCREKTDAEFHLLHFPP